MNFHGISYWGSIDVNSNFFTFVSADSGELPALNVQPKSKPMMMMMVVVVIIIIKIIIISSSSSSISIIQARSVFMGVGI